MKTVNFIEAINSGRRFRPIDWGREIYNFIDIDGVDQMISHNYFNAQFELEEKKVTISESEFDEIANNINCYKGKSFMCDLDDLKKELGF